jgi:periplasmic protein CpxP/Spy
MVLTQTLAKQVKLTSDQETKVENIFQSESSRIVSLFQDTSLPQQDRRTKMMDIHTKNGTEIRALLDPTQQKKWDEMQATRPQRMQVGPPAPQGEDLPARQ